MLRLMWLESNLTGETLESWLERVNSLEWNISVVRYEDHWCVLSGDQDVLRSDSREAVDAFLYGLALAYAVIPDHIFTDLQDRMRKR